MKQLTVRSLAIVLATLLLAAMPAAAQELTADEASCQQRSSFVMASYGRRYSKCALKCAKKLGAPTAASSCTESGACGLGGNDKTCRCFDRAALTAVRTQVGRCSDCPECYVNNGGDTNPECQSDAEAKESTLGAFVDSLFFTGSPAVFCDDSLSLNGHTLAETKCQLATLKSLGTLARQKALCLADCRELERAGQVLPGGCDPPLLTNPNAPSTARNCVSRWESKSIDKIAKRCEPSEGGAKPDCWGAQDGPAWVAMVENFVVAQDPTYFCAFPSGAFLER
jgi:hypothetical protein